MAAQAAPGGGDREPAVRGPRMPAPQGGNYPRPASLRGRLAGTLQGGSVGGLSYESWLARPIERFDETLTLPVSPPLDVVHAGVGLYAGGVGLSSERPKQKK